MALNVEKFLLDRRRKWSSKGLEWLSLYHQTLQEVPWCYDASELAQEEKGSKVAVLGLYLVCSHCTLLCRFVPAKHSTVQFNLPKKSHGMRSADIILWFFCSFSFIISSCPWIFKVSVWTYIHPFYIILLSEFIKLKNKVGWKDAWRSLNLICWSKKDQLWIQIKIWS